MAIRNILKLGDEGLRKRSRPVEGVDRRTKQLLDDLADTMYDADGAGLAAPQVGVLRRLVVIDVGEGLIELINPEIIQAEGAAVVVEGCLSVPGRQGKVERPTRVVVRALNRRGKEIEVEGTGYLAVALCHEIDHLDGVIYVDKMLEEVAEEEK